MTYIVMVIIISILVIFIFSRWFKESLYSSDEDKMNDAIDNIRFYFAHVMNGVSTYNLYCIKIR